MKQFINFLAIFALAICLMSCATVYSSTTYGDISLLTETGITLREWDNASLDNETVVTDGWSYSNKVNSHYAIKNGGGLSFTDSRGETHYINGGIIIVDNIRTTAEKSDYFANTNTKSVNPEQKKLTDEYVRLKLQINENKKRLKTIDKTSEEYAVRQEQTSKMKERQKELSSILWKNYGVDTHTL